jgi:uncharacterized membrane protein
MTTDDELAGQSWLGQRLLILAQGAFLLWLAGVVYAVGDVGTHPGTVAAVFVTQLAGFAVLGLGIVMPRSLNATRRIVLAIALVASIAAFAGLASATPGYGTDTLALSHLAGESMLAGRNPYEEGVPPLVLEQRFGLPQTAITQLEGGGYISALVSYPALHDMLFVPALALGVHDLRWVVFAFQLACIAVLLMAAPRSAQLAALAVLLVNGELAFDYTVGSLTDWLWVLPLMGTAWALHRRRVLLAAILFGLACSIKQPPWFAAPFLAVWAWQLGFGGWRNRLGSAAAFASSAVGTFGVVNSPFLLLDAPAWFQSVFQPLTQPLIPHGYGISLLTQTGMLPLPPTFYFAVTVLAGVAAIALYWIYFPRFPSAAWLLPMILLWFNYRAFPNYIVYWLPVLALSILLEWRTAKPDWARIPL